MTRAAFRISLLVAVFMITSGLTWVSFVKNYGDWQRLTPQGKVGYVMGAFDQQQEFNPMASNTVGLNYAIGVQQCSDRNGLSPELLVQLVDKYYVQHTNSWKSPASEILALALYDLCKEEINAALKKAGLQPIPEIPQAP